MTFKGIKSIQEKSTGRTAYTTNAVWTWVVPKRFVYGKLGPGVGMLRGGKVLRDGS